MEAVVKKWGNSLGIRIPNLIARELSLKDGSCVGISYRGKEIIIKPIQKTGCPKCWAKSTNKTFMTKLKQQARLVKKYGEEKMHSRTRRHRMVKL